MKRRYLIALPIKPSILAILRIPLSDVSHPHGQSSEQPLKFGQTDIADTACDCRTFYTVRFVPFPYFIVLSCEAMRGWRAPCRPPTNQPPHAAGRSVSFLHRLLRRRPPCT